MTDTVAITEQPTSGNVKRRMMFVAGLAATAAAGYGAYRIYTHRAELKARRDEIVHWIEEKVGELSSALKLEPKQIEEFEKQVVQTAHSILGIMSRLVLVSPRFREVLKYTMEKRFLKMKLELHKLLKLRNSGALAQLEEFYEDLRAKLFRHSETEPTSTKQPEKETTTTPHITRVTNEAMKPATHS